jgi:hypothetical protein
VPWATTTKAGTFLAEAGQFLVSDPVANSVLLTEARFWARFSNPVPGARFGWWNEGGGVRGAFVHVPDHAPICSPLSTASAAELPRALSTVHRLGVQAQDVAAVTAAWWAARRQVLRVSARIGLLRLRHLRAPALPRGAPRVADTGDLPLLRSWFSLFRERFPEDPSHVEFVVDHPLQEQSVIVWEVQGRPVAMASRTPEMAGMVRMGLAFQPAEGTAYADAAFAVGCEAAAREAEHVLVLSGTPGSTAAYQSLGFEPVLDRALLEVRESSGPETSELGD